MDHRARKDKRDPERAAVKALQREHGRDTSTWPPEALATLRTWEAKELTRKAKHAALVADATHALAEEAAQIAATANAAAEAARAAVPPPPAEQPVPLVPEAPPADGAGEAGRG